MMTGRCPEVGCPFTSSTYARQLHYVKAYVCITVTIFRCIESLLRNTRSLATGNDTAPVVQVANWNAVRQLILGLPTQIPELPIKASNPARGCTLAAVPARPHSLVWRARSPPPVRSEVRVAAIQPSPRWSKKIWSVAGPEFPRLVSQIKAKVQKTQVKRRVEGTKQQLSNAVQGMKIAVARRVLAHELWW